MLTPEQTGAALNYVVAIVLIAALVIGLGSMLLGRLLAAYDLLAPAINAFGAALTRRYVAWLPALADDATMSSYDVSEALQSRPPAQTDGRTDGRTGTDSMEPAPVAITPQQRAGLVALCQSLRAAGKTREDARLLLRGVGVQFSNDVWTDAKPAAHVEAMPTALTPFAGRPYDPTQYYEDEPALQYHAPTA